MRKTYADLIHDAWREDKKNIEVREPKSGLRHNKKTIYVTHRFPVKGGISYRQYLENMLYETNPIFEMLRKGEPS